MCFDVGLRHLGCWGQNTSRIQNKEVYATLCVQVQEAWAEHRRWPDGEPPSRWRYLVDSAIAYMSHPDLADHPVRLPSEVRCLDYARELCAADGV